MEINEVAINKNKWSVEICWGFPLRKQNFKFAINFLAMHSFYQVCVLDSGRVYVAEEIPFISSFTML